MIERSQRLVCEMLRRGMIEGRFRTMDPLVASRMLSSLFVTHAIWHHQRTSFKSIGNTPDEVLLDQIRDFFFHAMRPDARDASPHASS